VGFAMMALPCVDVPCSSQRRPTLRASPARLRVALAALSLHAILVDGVGGGCSLSSAAATFLKMLRAAVAAVRRTCPCPAIHKMLQ
jgi:hypothetical protein